MEGDIFFTLRLRSCLYSFSEHRSLKTSIMEDLDEMILEATGRTGRNQHSTPPSRRQRKGSYSDDGSDSRDDDSDDDRGYATRKPSGPPVPLKKRIDQSEHDDEHSSSHEDDDDRYDREGDGDDDSVGSDLYKDEEDRQKLAKMSELDREMILADRPIIDDIPPHPSGGDTGAGPSGIRQDDD
ncbi:hypothetical protein L2E82_35111 [Cichorium intybus]|uniref:Uncharacterized protein n=1 Tax=Cichorium intybus TaxID=13427 RepID=A0ACB9BN80_CICIN|nr:hypothetical protein L2E82_35111 [Cichorium intybus]